MAATNPRDKYPSFPYLLHKPDIAGRQPRQSVQGSFTEADLDEKNATIIRAEWKDKSINGKRSLYYVVPRSDLALYQTNSNAANQGDKFLQTFGPGWQNGTVCLNEVLRPGVKVRPYFDIDVTQEAVPGLNIDQVALAALEWVIESASSMFEGGVDVGRDFMVFASHKEGKRSHHVTMPTVWLDDTDMMGVFFEEMVKKNPPSEVVAKVVDKGVYSPRHSMRMALSSKAGEMRPKVLLKKFRYLGKEFTRVDSDRVIAFRQAGSIEARDNAEWQGSLISWASVGSVDGYPKLVAPVLPKKEKKAWGAGSLGDGWRVGLEELAKYFGGELPFEHEVWDGHLALRRTRRALCPMCDRDHESDGMMLWYGEWITAWCRRGVKGKNTKRLCRNPDWKGPLSKGGAASSSSSVIENPYEELERLFGDHYQKKYGTPLIYTIKEPNGEIGGEKYRLYEPAQSICAVCNMGMTVEARLTHLVAIYLSKGTACCSGEKNILLKDVRKEAEDRKRAEAEEKARASAESAKKLANELVEDVFQQYDPREPYYLNDLYKYIDRLNKEGGIDCGSADSEDGVSVPLGIRLTIMREVAKCIRLIPSEKGDDVYCKRSDKFPFACTTFGKQFHTKTIRAFFTTKFRGDTREVPLKLSIGRMLEMYGYYVRSGKTVMRPYHEMEDLSRDEFNTFPGFAARRIAFTAADVDQYVTPWLDHTYVVLANRDWKRFCYILTHKCFPILNVGQKCRMILGLLGPQRCGKGRVGGFFIKRIFGSLCSTYLKSSSELAGRFNQFIDGAVYIYIAEIAENSRRGSETYEAVKTLATDEYNNIEGKGTNMIANAESFANVEVDFNNAFNLALEEGDMRWVTCEASGCKVGDVAYFNKLSYEGSGGLFSQHAGDVFYSWIRSGGLERYTGVLGGEQFTNVDLLWKDLSVKPGPGTVEPRKNSVAAFLDDLFNRRFILSSTSCAVGVVGKRKGQLFISSSMLVDDYKRFVGKDEFAVTKAMFYSMIKVMLPSRGGEDAHKEMNKRDHNGYWFTADKVADVLVGERNMLRQDDMVDDVKSATVLLGGMKDLPSAASSSVGVQR